MRRWNDASPPTHTSSVEPSRSDVWSADSETSTPPPPILASGPSSTRRDRLARSSLPSPRWSPVHSMFNCSVKSVIALVVTLDVTRLGLALDFCVLFALFRQQVSWLSSSACSCCRNLTSSTMERIVRGIGVLVTEWLWMYQIDMWRSMRTCHQSERSACNSSHIILQLTPYWAWQRFLERFETVVVARQLGRFIGHWFFGSASSDAPPTLTPEWYNCRPA